MLLIEVLTVLQSEVLTVLQSEVLTVLQSEVLTNVTDWSIKCYRLKY